MLSFPNSRDARRRAVAFATALTAGTPLAPSQYERQLLARYVRGELTLTQVAQTLQAGVYHVLYHSRLAPGPWQALLQQARRDNAAHRITGVLFHGAGQVVHLLEGDQAAVSHLYTRIQEDTRHAQVVTVSRGAAPTRQFAERGLVVTPLQALEMEHLLGALTAAQPPVPWPVHSDVAAVRRVVYPAR